MWKLTGTDAMAAVYIAIHCPLYRHLTSDSCMRHITGELLSSLQVNH